MSKYYVPVDIDGKWWVVENVSVPDAEDYHSQDGNGLYFDEDGYKDHCDLYCNPPKYPTLPSDSAYWASKEGVKMTSEEFEFDPCCDYLCNGLCKEIGNTKYAVPLRGVDKAPIQSPTIKELIEQEAERLFHADTEGVFHKPSWLDGANFALSLPKQDNGDAWDEAWGKFKEKYGVVALDTQTLTLFNHLKQHYSISKIK